jgi:hypothetical protein
MWIAVSPDLVREGEKYLRAVKRFLESVLSLEFL